MLYELCEIISTHIIHLRLRIYCVYEQSVTTKAQITETNNI